MRRIAGPVLVGLGVALLTLGIALRFYAYPQLARVTAEYPLSKEARPAGQEPDAATTTSLGTGVQVFVTRTGQPIGPQTLDVESVRSTRGDVAAARGDAVYWETRVETFAPALPGPEALSTVVEGVCFDRTSGAASTGCDRRGYVQTERDATRTLDRSGQYFKFPFATEQRSYPFWDGQVGEPVEARYAGTEEIDGLTVYKFVQTIADRSIGTREDVPGSLFGSRAPQVDADIRYANVRTLWVEPETGVIVRGQEQQNRRMVAEGKEVALAVGTLAYGEKTVADTVLEQRDNARSLSLLRTVLPWTSGVLGALLLVAGLALVLLSTRRRRGRRAAGRPVPTPSSGTAVPRQVDLTAGERQPQDHG